MGNTLGGPTGPGGMMKTMKDMMSLTGGGGGDRESSMAAEKLPDGEKYFGFVNVGRVKELNQLGIEYLLCKLGPASPVPLPALQAAYPGVQAPEARAQGHDAADFGPARRLRAHAHHECHKKTAQGGGADRQYQEAHEEDQGHELALRQRRPPRLPRVPDVAAQHHPRGGGRRPCPRQDEGAPTESRLRGLRGAPSLADRVLPVRVGGRT